MPVRPRGNSWQASVCIKGQIARKSFKSRQEAGIWEAETVAAMLSGKWSKEEHRRLSEVTLQDHLDRVAEARWRGKKAAETLITNARQAVTIIGASRSVASLTKADADKVRIEFRRRGASDATINRKLAALSVLVNEAVERGLLDRGFRVGITKERQSRIRFLTEAEDAAMVAWCEQTGNDDLRDYIIVSLDTGFRQGEVLKIEARDCGQPNLWTYDTKSGKSREVPLTDRVQEVLVRRSKFIAPEDRVFSMSAAWLRDRWFKLQTALGLSEDEGFIPHVMRHTFVTRLLHNGVDIKTVMELAGHSRIETTQRYAQTSPERKVLAIQKLSGYQSLKLAS